MKFKNYLDCELLIREGIEDKGIFKCAFLSGAPASGKSYTLSKIKSGAIEPRIVNTDKFFEFLDPTDWDTFGHKAKTLTKKQLVLYLNSMLPLAIDGTSSNGHALIRRQGLIESIGYDTAMVFVNTTLEISLERVRKRNAEGKRQVPEDLVKQIHKKVNKLKGFYKSKFNPFFEVNNDDGELDDDMILKSFKKLTGFYNLPLQSPLGIDRVEEMRENGWKYLQPNIMTLKELSKIVSVWYKK